MKSTCDAGLYFFFNFHLIQTIDKQQDKLTLNERITLNKTLLAYILPTIKHEQASEFIEQPLFNDVYTEEQKPFDVKDLFRIGEL